MPILEGIVTDDITHTFVPATGHVLSTISVQDILDILNGGVPSSRPCVFYFRQRTLALRGALALPYFASAYHGYSTSFLCNTFLKVCFWGALVYAATNFAANALVVVAPLSSEPLGETDILARPSNEPWVTPSSIAMSAMAVALLLSFYRCAVQSADFQFGSHISRLF